MNFKKQGVYLGALLLVWCFTLAAEDPEKANREKTSLLKGAGSPIYGLINIGNITSWMRNDGQSNHSPGGDNGMYYPKGTGNVIYQDCVNWGSKVFLDAAKTRPAASKPIRVGGGSYGVGTKAGWVTGQGSLATAVIPAAGDNVRAWRVRRDYASMSDAEAAADAASNNEVPITDVTAAMIASTKAQYDLDWTNWGSVIQFGAPYVERNGTAGYQAPPAFTNITDKTITTFTVDSLIAQNRDEPGIAGIDPNSPADQVIWAAFNDLDVTQSLSFEGSDPTGLEISKIMWAYKRSDALGNLYFTKYRIINKGGVDTTVGVKGSFWLDSMYVCQWSDPDLGGFTDDLVGCDTTLSMGFIYNANPVDETFKLFGLAPASSGYDFLQGPIVPAPGDSGVFNLKRRYNVKNLGMSAFAYFSAGSPYSDPPGGPANYAAGTSRWYKMHRGFAPLGDFTNAPVPYNSGPFAVSKFPLSGDPVARTGFVDGLGTLYSFAPGDRRLLVITGPFSMAPGDTQEVVLGVVVGLGSDRLSSVAVLKFNDRFAQNTYNALFAVPKPPKPPTVKVAELDGELVLEWGSDLANVTDIETKTNNPGAFKFEGYNVYQLPSRGSRLSAGKRISTFDLTTDPAVVLDQQFDNTSGQILNIPVQFGSNSGVTRYVDLKRDFVRDIDKLWNGQEYYYAVTAYAVSTQPGFLPAVLESDALVFVARPKAPGAGTRGQTSALSNLSVAVTAGVTDLQLPVRVIDPSALKNLTYTISFRVVGPTTFWDLKNKATGATLFSSSNLGTVISGVLDDDNNYPIINGIRPFVAQENPVILLAAGTDVTNWVGGTAPPQLGGGARFSGGPSARGVVTTGADLGNSYLGQFSSSYDGASLKKIEIRFTPTGSKAYRLRRTGGGTEYQVQTTVVAGAAPAGEGFVTVPFSVWDMSTATPRQISASWRDQDASATYNPPVGSDGVEIIFVYNKSYDATGNQFRHPTATTNIGAVINNECTVGANADVMYGFSFGSVGAQISGAPGSVATSTFTVRPKYVLSSAVVFEFSTTAPTYDAAVAKTDAESKVGVFPNPYYAQNAAETSRFSRFVTFNNLPAKATIRIFNLAGQLVKVLEKNDASQYIRWDLLNRFSFPVASGVYVAHVDMPDIAATKVLKLGIIQEQEILPSF